LELERLAEQYEQEQVAKRKQPKQDDEPSGELLPEVKLDKVYLWEVEHLGSRFPSEAPPKRENVMRSKLTDSGHEGGKYNKLVHSKECILADIVRTDLENTTSTAYIRAGPRQYLHFDTQKVNAAIVTCGGLCPGLNNGTCVES
jgi:6-phosphofructokinase 1